MTSKIELKQVNIDSNPKRSSLPVQEKKTKITTIYQDQVFVAVRNIIERES